MIEQFLIDIKNLLVADYSPTDNGKQPLYFTTTEVFRKVTGVVPKTPLSEHDIYKLMQELEFQIYLRKIYELDDNGEPTNKLADEYYCWLMYPKK